MIKQEVFDQALDLITSSQRILISTHNKPDGDALGSLVAMQDALNDLGKEVVSLILSPAPDWYGFLKRDGIQVLNEDLTQDELMTGKLGCFDLVIIVDVNSVSQLPQFSDYLTAIEAPVLVIDHHATADGLGTVEVVDHQAAATGLLVYELAKYAQWPITPSMAEAMFVATATDTGWFQFINTDGRVYRDCAALIDAGARPKVIYDKLYHNYSVPRFDLMVAMLNSMERHFENRFVLQVITQDDFKRTGADPEDTENLINECFRMACVEASALLTELEDGRVRCSLRSCTDLDVSAIAAQFGGGGHVKAAGTFLSGPLDHAKAVLLEQFQPHFQ